MDIFFFITSVAIILFTLCTTFVLWQFSRILKNIEHISEQVALGSDVVRTDFVNLRADIKKGKGRLKSLWNFFGMRVKRASHNKK